MSDVEHLTEGDHRGAFVVQRDGKRLAEMTYSLAGAGKAMFDHTWVSDELRGQGVARKLLDAAMAWVRKEQLKVIPVCPYVKSQLDRDESLKDLRYESP